MNTEKLRLGVLKCKKKNHDFKPSFLVVIKTNKKPKVIQRGARKLYTFGRGLIFFSPALWAVDHPTPSKGLGNLNTECKVFMISCRLQVFLYS